MNLELSDIEKEKLVKVLEYFIPELRGEIASGGKREWRMEMKSEEAILNGLLEKVKNLN